MLQQYNQFCNNMHSKFNVNHVLYIHRVVCEHPNYNYSYRNFGACRLIIVLSSILATYVYMYFNKLNTKREECSAGRVNS